MFEYLLESPFESLLEYLHAMYALARTGQAQGIHFWGSAYVVLVMAFTLRHILGVRRWPHTKGELLHLGTRAFSENSWQPAATQHVPDALYRYEVNGKIYQGRELSVWKVAASGALRNSLSLVLRQVKTDAEGRVRVYYHPENPEKCLLIRPAWGSLAFVSLCLLGTIVFYVWCWR